MHFYVALNFDVGLYRQHGDKKKILHSSIKVLLCFCSHILYPQRKNKWGLLHGFIIISFNSIRNDNANHRNWISKTYHKRYHTSIYLIYFMEENIHVKRNIIYLQQPDKLKCLIRKIALHIKTTCIYHYVQHLVKNNTYTSRSIFVKR